VAPWYRSPVHESTSSEAGLGCVVEPAMPLALGWALSRHPSSKWGGVQGSRQPWLLGARGLLLYLPLAISLSLNTLWASSFFTQEGALSTTHGSASSSQTQVRTLAPVLWPHQQYSCAPLPRFFSSATEALLGIHLKPMVCAFPWSPSTVWPHKLLFWLRWLGEQVAVKGDTCGQETLRRAQEHLSDVVLIVSFADDATARNASSFVRDLYSRFFLQVIVCAPTTDEELRIEGRTAVSQPFCVLPACCLAASILMSPTLIEGLGSEGSKGSCCMGCPG